MADVEWTRCAYIIIRLCKLWRSLGYLLDATGGKGRSSRHYLVYVMMWNIMFCSVLFIAWLVLQKNSMSEEWRLLNYLRISINSGIYCLFLYISSIQPAYIHQADWGTVQILSMLITKNYIFWWKLFNSRNSFARWLKVGPSFFLLCLLSCIYHSTSHLSHFSSWSAANFQLFCLVLCIHTYHKPSSSGSLQTMYYESKGYMSQFNFEPTWTCSMIRMGWMRSYLG